MSSLSHSVRVQVDHLMRIKRVLNRIIYHDWIFAVGGDDGDDLWMQVRFVAADSRTGHPAGQTSRKWRLSPHMTDSEILQTALLAVLTAAEHEVRERFLVDGRAIYGPHLSADALWEAAEQKDARVPPPRTSTAAVPRGVRSELPLQGAKETGAAAPNQPPVAAPCGVRSELPLQGAKGNGSSVPNQPFVAAVCGATIAAADALAFVCDACADRGDCEEESLVDSETQALAAVWEWTEDLDDRAFDRLVGWVAARREDERPSG